MLEVKGNVDVLLYEKEEAADGTKTKKRTFPFTRYENTLNHPRIIRTGSSIALTPNTEFSLVTTEEIEVSDDKIFELFKQTW